MKNLIFISFLFFSICRAYPCKCIGNESLETEFKNTELVFQGTVLSKEIILVKETMNGLNAALLEEKIGPKKSDLEFFNQKLIYKVQLQVNKIFKGIKNQKKIIIYTAIHSGACGYRAFEAGKEFLVYASSKSYLYHKFDDYQITDLEKDNTYWTHHCTLTKEFDVNEATQLAELSKAN